MALGLGQNIAGLKGLFRWQIFETNFWQIFQFFHRRRRMQSRHGALLLESVLIIYSNHYLLQKKP